MSDEISKKTEAQDLRYLGKSVKNTCLFQEVLTNL